MAPSAGWRNRIVGHGEEAPDQLLANPRNWRLHPKHQQDALAGVLSEVGWVQDVIVNRTTGHVVDGHARVGIAISQREASVPVVYVELTPDEEAKVLATFDPLGAMAGADREQLAELLGDVQTDDAALRRSLKDLADDHGAAFGAAGLTETPDESPTAGEERAAKAEALRGKWDVRPGQLWAVGRHRLLCGDCTSEEDVRRLLGGEAHPLLLSDPPYCSGASQEAGKAAGTWGDIASDNLSTRGYVSLLSRMLQAVRPQAAYLFTDWRMWIPLYDLTEGNGLAARSMIVWDKGTPGLGGLWRTQHELILFASRATNPRIKGVAARGNVLRVNRTGNDWHYTEKPVEVIAALLENDAATERGACPVLDVFVGSGTTLLAAEQAGRVGYGMDVEPKCVAVALERLSAAGLEPKLSEA